jgi:hypothetical protein
LLDVVFARSFGAAPHVGAIRIADLEHGGERCLVLAARAAAHVPVIANVDVAAEVLGASNIIGAAKVARATADALERPGPARIRAWAEVVAARRD